MRSLQAWNAAGSEAPRRFGFCWRATHDLGVSTAVGSRAKAPSPLRSAGALQTWRGLRRFMASLHSFFRMHWEHERLAVRRQTESADKSDALQPLCAVRRAQQSRSVWSACVL